MHGHAGILYFNSIRLVSSYAASRNSNSLQGGGNKYKI